MAPKPRHFGPYTLDPGKGELLRANARVPLQPQPLRLLILLTDQPGDLVTRDQIRDTIWGKDTFVEFEHALSYAISQIRYALRDSATSPRFIRTEPRRGYRFIAPISVEPAPATPAPAAPVPATPAPVVPTPSTPIPPTPARLASTQPGPAPVEPLSTPLLVAEPRMAATTLPQAASPAVSSSTQPVPLLQSRPAHPLRWAAVAALVLIAIAAAVLLRPRTAAVPPPQSTSIAILPVVNLTGDPTCENLADSLTDELIARLAVISQNRLRVTARTSSMFYKGKSVTAASVGRELNTAYILESTLRLEPVSPDGTPASGPASRATRLRLTTQLIRTADDTHLWTQISDISSAQLFSTTGALASSILSALPLRPTAATNSGEYVSPSPAAQAAFLRGQHLFSLRTRESLLAAVEAFQAAIAADPAYARAHARLAATWLLMGGYSILPQKQAADLAEPALNRALQLDPTLADAYATRGYLRWFYQWNWAAGEQDFLNAIHRDANNVDAMHWYAMSLATSRRFEEADDWMRRALQIDPHSLILNTNHGVIQAISGNPTQGAETIEATLAENPSFFSARLKLWGIYSALHRDEDAYRHLRLLYSMGSAPDEALAVDQVRNRHGYPAAVALWRAKPGFQGTVVEAQLALAAGDREAAIQTILKGYREHDGWMVYVFTDPALQPLLEDARLRPIAYALSPTVPAGLAQP